jgi:hypothetical protein
MGKTNVADDFTEAIHKEQDADVQRGVPPLHPKEKGKWVNLAEEEPIPGLIDHNLIQLPKRKLKARLRRFCVSDPDQVEEYEKIQDKCLEGKGWILAREEWTTDKEGETYIIVKYLEPQPEDKKGSGGE